MSSPVARAADQRANGNTPIVSHLKKVSDLSADVNTPILSQKKNSAAANSKESQNTDNSSSYRTQYNPFYHRQPPSHAPKPTTDPYTLDKEINFKNKQQRTYIHRYNLKFPVKKPKDEDAELLAIRSSLQKFLELLLQADETIIIPPFYELV